MISTYKRLTIVCSLHSLIFSNKKKIIAKKKLKIIVHRLTKTVATNKEAKFGLDMVESIASRLFGASLNYFFDSDFDLDHVFFASQDSIKKKNIFNRKIA